MAGAIGLKGIHNVTGVCDLCGVVCNPNKEELNALDCTYKDCPPLVYHQDCLEKYLKSIRLEKNRKTGFKCPRGCGKGTRFKECCRGKVDKSHPIHVRHETKNEKKENVTQKEHSTADRDSKKLELKKRVRCDARNVHDLNLVKLVPKGSKWEEQGNEWGGTLQRSKSLDRTLKRTNQRHNKGRRSLGSITFHASPGKNRLRTSKSEVPPEVTSGELSESVRSQGELKREVMDPDPSSSDSASLHPSIGCESPERAQTNSLPSLQEESPRHAIQAMQDEGELHERCKKCLIQWKTDMLVQQLFRMGFEMWKATSAVHIFGSNVEEAIQWLVDNREISKSHISDILEHHPRAEICIEFELRTIMHISHHHQLDETQLEKTVIQFEGDLTSAIKNLLGYRSNECSFPDCDLSLGIVHSESPFLSSSSSSHHIVEGMTPCQQKAGLTQRRSLDTLSDDLMLGCVLGNALDAYKRGHADFTDLANQDLSCATTTTTTTTPTPISTYHTSAPSSMNSPLSPPTFSPSSFLLQDQGYHHHYNHFAPLESYGVPFGKRTEMSTNSELRHFIGDLLE